MSALLDALKTSVLASTMHSNSDFPRARPLHCAVSGGADSIALLLLARLTSDDVIAWHVDHGLRAGSSADFTMVEALATSLGVRAESRRIDVAPGANLEARAREARYAVLPPDVLTGHTADDQAETILINLLRGSGTSGLAGMRADRRPLLGLRRAQTSALCTELGITPFDDPMNRDPRFQRVRIRHELLPLLIDIAQRDMVEVLTRQALVLRDDDRLLDELAHAIDPSDAPALAKAPPALARRAIRRWLSDPYPPDVATIDRVLAVARGDVRACDIGAGREVRRSRQRLEILTHRMM